MDFPSKEDVKSILAGTFFLDDEPKRRGTIFNGDGDNSEPFTDEEVKAAKEIRDKIIQNQTSTLKTATHKTIYMAGEICMWDELRWNKPTQNESAYLANPHTEELSTPPVREVKSAEEFHNEFITCPNCKEINHANISRSNLKNLEYGSTEPKASTLLSPSEFYKVLHTILFGTYIHDCSKCGYTIMESEWDKLPYQKELEDYLKKYYPQLCTPQSPPVMEVKSAEDVLDGYESVSVMTDYDQYEDHYHKGCVLQAMEEYASQSTPHKEGYSVDGWVRVEDGLPELRVPVLVYMSYGKIDTCYWTGELWNQSVRPQHSNGSVTHWQPLPPPPNSLTN